HPTPDRLGGGARAHRPRGLGALCDRLPVAVPAFHGHRLDVPGRLRPGGLPRPAPGRREGPLRRPADLVAAGGPGVRQPRPAGGPDGLHPCHRRPRPGFRLPPLRRTVRAREVWTDGAPAPPRVDRLSPVAARPDDGGHASPGRMRVPTLFEPVVTPVAPREHAPARERTPDAGRPCGPARHAAGWLAASRPPLEPRAREEYYGIG